MTRNEPGTPGKPNHDEVHQGRIQQMTEWLESKLEKSLGPPHLGPYGDEPERTDAQNQCPLCDQPMGEHVIDRTNPNAVLICPVPPKPAVESFEPLNEVGMPKGAPRGTEDGN